MSRGARGWADEGRGTKRTDRRRPGCGRLSAGDETRRSPKVEGHQLLPISTGRTIWFCAKISADGLQTFETPMRTLSCTLMRRDRPSAWFIPLRTLRPSPWDQKSAECALSTDSHPPTSTLSGAPPTCEHLSTAPAYNERSQCSPRLPSHRLIGRIPRPGPSPQHLRHDRVPHQSLLHRHVLRGDPARRVIPAEHTCPSESRHLPYWCDRHVHSTDRRGTVPPAVSHPACFSFYLWFLIRCARQPQASTAEDGLDEPCHDRPHGAHVLHVYGAHSLGPAGQSNSILRPTCNRGRAHHPRRTRRRARLGADYA